MRDSKDGKVYETDKEFKEAVELCIGQAIPSEFWRLVSDLFMWKALHVPCTDIDVKLAAPKVKALLRLYRRKQK